MIREDLTVTTLRAPSSDTENTRRIVWEFNSWKQAEKRKFKNYSITRDFIAFTFTSDWFWYWTHKHHMDWENTSVIGEDKTGLKSRLVKESIRSVLSGQCLNQISHTIPEIFADRSRHFCCSLTNGLQFLKVSHLPSTNVKWSAIPLLVPRCQANMLQKLPDEGRQASPKT